MDDAIKKFRRDEADAMRKVAGDLDVEKRPGLTSAVEEAMKSILSFAPAEGISFPSTMSVESLRMPNISAFEETNNLQSAGVLLRRLADSIVGSSSNVL